MINGANSHSKSCHRKVQALLTASLMLSACADKADLPAARSDGNAVRNSEYDSAQSQQPADSLILTPVVRLGQSELSSNAETIGKARAVIEANNRLFVLDSDWKKIFVFGVDGAFQATIGDGYGLNPGQLALPVDMSIHQDKLYVLDYELERVSMWDTAGGFRGVISLAKLQPRGIETAESGIYIRLMWPRAKHWGVRIDSTGKILQHAFAVDEADKSFSDAGYGGALTPTADGKTVAFIHPHGALAVAEGEPARLEPLPKLFKRPDGFTVAERATFGAVYLTGDRLLLLQARSTISKDEYELAVFDPNRRLTARYRFPAGLAPLSVDRGSESNVLNITYLSDKGPKVVRYKMEVKGG